MPLGQQLEVEHAKDTVPEIRFAVVSAAAAITAGWTRLNGHPSESKLDSGHRIVKKYFADCRPARCNLVVMGLKSCSFEALHTVRVERL